MPLTLRPTGLASPVYRDQLDYTVIEDGREIGRLYEDRNTQPELRWFWSITRGQPSGYRDTWQNGNNRRGEGTVHQELESGEWQERVTRARGINAEHPTAQAASPH